MNPHLHLHFGHSHDGLFGRVARDLGTALDRMTGPALSQQQRLPAGPGRDQERPARLRRPLTK